MSLVYSALQWEEICSFAKRGDQLAMAEVLRRVAGKDFEKLIKEAEERGYEEGFKEGLACQLE